MFKRIAGQTLLVLGLTAINSQAAETNRFIRSLPNFTSAKWDTIDSNRVSLWPVCYRNNNMTSVLWPIIDYDKQGYAIRPFITKDNNEHSILFPLSNWHTDKQKGWAGPVWWDHNNYGIFPLANKTDELSHIGPYWWNDNKRGLFPLYSIKQDTTSWNYSSGFGLISNWEKNSNGDYNYWQFPNVYLSKDGNNTNRMILPYYSNDNNGVINQGVFPLYRKKQDGQSSELRVAEGLFNYTYRNGDDYKIWQFPNVYLSNDGNNTNRMILPYYSNDNNGVINQGVFPLYRKKQDGQSNEFRIAEGLFNYTYRNGDDYKIWQFPNVYLSNDGDKSNKIIFPYYQNHDKNSSTHGILPFYQQEKTGDTKKYRSLGGAFNFTKSTPDSFKMWQFPNIYINKTSSEQDYVLFPYYNLHNSSRDTTGLFPLYNRTTTPNANKLTLGAGILTNYEYNTLGDNYSLWQFPNIYLKRTENSTDTVIFPYYTSSYKENVTNHGIFPLYHKENGENKSKLTIGSGLLANYKQEGDNEKLWVFPAYYKSQTKDSSTKVLFPYYSWRDSETEGSGLFPVYTNYKDDQGSATFTLLSASYKGGDRSWASILGPLYITKKDKSSTYKSIMWPFYIQNEDKFLKKQQLWPLYVNQEGDTKPGISSYFSLYSSWKVKGDDKSAFYNGSPVPEVSQKELLWGSIFFHKKDLDSTKTTSLLGLLTDYKDEKSNGQDLTSFRVLKYLYRYEKRDKKVYRDIFPAIKMDSAPNERSISFLWNMFSYKKKDGKKSGHFLFFPIG